MQRHISFRLNPLSVKFHWIIRQYIHFLSSLMSAIKRVFLFVLMNLAIILMGSVTIWIVSAVFGINVSGYLGGSDGYLGLAIFSLIFGFAGSFFSLAISRWSAKRLYGIRLLDSANLFNYPEKERLVYASVETIARQQGIDMPEVGVYDAPDPNAFATGATRNRSLVAVSTGLLDAMTPAEIEGVIAHEMAHILNGDMVTMTLLQGILNTFVIFISRVIGYALDSAMRKDEESSAPGFGYYIVVMVLEIALSMLASLVLMAFSRHREYRADAGSAEFVGRDKMIAALRRLKTLTERTDAYDDGQLAAFKISARDGWLSAFSSHPSLDDRIAVLERTWTA
ncbi:MAG TPA: protease HtpX [bacterium]|nr:protease HtpX [bacterium]